MAGFLFENTFHWVFVPDFIVIGQDGWYFSDDPHSRQYKRFLAYEPWLSRIDGKAYTTVRGVSETECTLKGHSGLFMQFAALREDEDSILAFARKYGPLWISGSPRGSWASREMGDMRERRFAVPLESWFDAIRSMRQWVFVWNRLQTGRPRDVDALVQWSSEKCFFCRKDQTGEVVFDKFDISGALERFGGMPQSARELARFVLGIALEAGSSGLIPSEYAIDLIKRRMTHHDRSPLSGGMNVQIRPTSSNPYHYQLEPRDLHTALWWQFLMSVSTDQHFGECYTCHDPFRVLRSSPKVQHRFCSTKCKLKNARRRQKEAKLAWERGVPVAQIAQDIDTSEETIQAWVTKTRKNRTRKSIGGGNEQ